MAQESKSTESIAVTAKVGAAGDKQDEDHEYLTGFQFYLAHACIGIVLFVVILDSTLISTAAPAITDEFRSLKDLGWYSSVYYMTFCIAQLQFGKLMVRYPIRIVYTACMALFLVGSGICGGAPNSVAFIIGRAIAGVGAAGLLVGSFALIPILTPPPQRPAVTGIIGGVIGLAMSVGPMVGGAMTQNVTWRWNFYMNLPIGSACYFIFLLVIRPPSKAPPIDPLTLRTFVRKLDLYGLALLTPCVVCLLIALQWGGTTYAWSDRRIVALLVVSGILGLAFIAVEGWWAGSDAMIPKHIISQQSVYASVFFALTDVGAGYLFAYYIPIWFQASKGDDPLHAGVNTLPLVIVECIASIVCGMGVASLGHIWPFMVAASCFTAVGAGLFTTWNRQSSIGVWIGYQIVYGVGMGLAAQTPLMVMQSLLAIEDMPIGSSLIMMTQSLGGSIWVSVTQAIFVNKLRGGLARLGLPPQQIEQSLAGGLTDITRDLTGNVKTEAMDAVNDALVFAWKLPVFLTTISIIGALGVQYRRSKAGPDKS